MGLAGPGLAEAFGIAFGADGVLEVLAVFVELFGAFAHGAFVVFWQRERGFGGCRNEPAQDDEQCDDDGGRERIDFLVGWFGLEWFSRGRLGGEFGAVRFEALAVEFGLGVHAWMIG